MAFCAKCGAAVSEGATFCGSCGAPVGAVAGGTPPGAAAGTALASNVAGLLTYIPLVGWIIAVIFLVIEPYKNDKLVRFHAFQSIFFSIVCFVVYEVLGTFLFSAAWGVGFSMFWMMWGLIRLAIFACWLFLMYKAYNNERYMIPVIGALAAKQAG